MNIVPRSQLGFSSIQPKEPLIVTDQLVARPLRQRKAIAYPGIVPRHGTLMVIAAHVELDADFLDRGEDRRNCIGATRKTFDLPFRPIDLVAAVPGPRHRRWKKKRYQDRVSTPLVLASCRVAMIISALPSQEWNAERKRKSPGVSTGAFAFRRTEKIIQQRLRRQQRPWRPFLRRVPWPWCRVRPCWGCCGLHAS